MMVKKNRRASILIVDDQPENISILAEYFKSEHKVMAATSGESALKLAFADKKLDLILLDIMMPGIDGFEVCRRLKANPQTRDIPVIFLTAMTESKSKIKGFNVGAVDYITKPFESELVMARANLHLELKAHREHLQELVAEQTLDLKASNQRLQTALTNLEKEIAVRKETEEQLRASEIKMASIIDAIHGFIYVCNCDNFRIRFMNKPLIDYLGGNRVGEICYQAIFGFDTPCRRCGLGKILKGQTVEGEIQNASTGHWYHTIHTPLQNPRGEVDQCQTIFIDITKRKQAEEALRAEEEFLRQENLLLKSSLKERFRFGDIVGKSKSMQRVYQTILKAASSDASVVIYGESGTGKELVARAIHERSRRREHAMVTVNCGAIPADLAESEFFGHLKGAFTGAVNDKDGFLDSADGGALFLDEIGEIPLSLQIKLLRAIESGGFSPVGGSNVKQPDFRIIAASNKDLKAMVANGSMRKDFFYRIHIIPIHLPPLRERREDIPLLVDHFLQKYDPGHQHPLDVKVMNALYQYDWPGNVRELQNTLHRYVTLNKIDFMDTDLSVDDKPKEAGVNVTTENRTLRDVIQSVEKELIADALHQNRWRRARAAKRLGIDPKTLYRKIKQYRLS